MHLIFFIFGSQNKSNMLIMNILIVIDDLDPKLKYGPIFMKFGTWSKSNMLIMNIEYT